MPWKPHQLPQQMVKTYTWRQLLTAVCILTLTIAIMGSAAITYRVSAAPTGPAVASNFLVDQDHNLPFSQNKQNEPAITRDPQTGVLIAGANDELIFDGGSFALNRAGELIASLPRFEEAVVVVDMDDPAALAVGTHQRILERQNATSLKVSLTGS